MARKKIGFAPVYWSITALIAFAVVVDLAKQEVQAPANSFVYSAGLASRNWTRTGVPSR